MSIFAPDAHLVVGLEDDAEDGSLRIYLDHRSTGIIHTHVADEEAKDEIRAAWAGSLRGHLTTRVPSSALCDCKPEPTGVPS